MIKTVKNFSELVMLQHSVFALPFIFIAMIVGSGGWFGWQLFVLGSLCAITARNFAMGFNRYVDIDIDSQNDRTSSRPSVDGRIAKAPMMVFIISNAIAFVFVAYLINSLAFKLSFPILLVIGGYSYLKRFSYMAHIVLGISLGFAPIAGVVAVSETVTAWSIYLGLGVVFWVAGFDVLYSMQDMDTDKRLKLHSIPSRYGFAKSMVISRVFHIVAVAFWLLFSISSGVDLFGYVAVVLSAVMLGAEHYIVSKDFKKIDKAFFTINGYLGIIYLLLIVLDKTVNI